MLGIENSGSRLLHCVDLDTGPASTPASLLSHLCSLTYEVIMARKISSTMSDVVGYSPRNANRSVGVGLSILSSLAALGRAGSLSEIARASGMPASRTHRFLAGMIHASAIRKDPVSGRYDLGPLMVNLGIAALGRVDGIKIASDVLGPLTAETGMVSVLVVWGMNGPMVVRWEQGDLDVVVRIREGRVLSLLRTGSGKLFLSYLPEEKTSRLLSAELGSKAYQGSSTSIRTKEDVAAMKAKVRREGLASNVGESDAGIEALAAPIFGTDGEMIMSIALIGLVGVADLGLNSEKAHALRVAAERVTNSLGGSLPLIAPTVSNVAETLQPRRRRSR